MRLTNSNLTNPITLDSLFGSIVDKKIAIGVHEHLYFAEVALTVDEKQCIDLVLFNAKTKRFKNVTVLGDASRAKISKPENPMAYIGFVAVLLQYFLSLNGSEALSIETTKCIELAKRKTCLDANNTLFLVQEFLKFITAEQIPLTLPVINLGVSTLNSQKLKPSKVFYGKFQVFSTNDKRENTNDILFSKDELLTKFKISNRSFSEEEQKMFFRIPDWYVPSKNVISIASKIKKSWNRPKHLHKVNVLMEGPAGTGKTMDAKVLSRLLGIPYTKVTCFADMDSSDVIGSILPVADEEKEKKKFPEEDEILLDPVSCYEDLTGIINENISAEEVLDELHSQIKKYYSSDEEKNTPEYRYYASEIVRAFENGYLCEIQEPTCVADAAVLLILNSALETDGVINLPQRTVKRHPEFICVMTTNRSYNGCRPLNQALRDRFNITKSVPLPDRSEIVQRLQKSTGCENDTLLNNTATLLNDLNVFLEDSGINASVSLRSAVDFVADVEDGFEISESLREDILYKITTDPMELLDIENFIETSTNISLD